MRFTSRISWLPATAQKFQGYRGGFFFEDDLTRGWVVSFQFLDELGNELPDGSALPKVCEAEMEFFTHRIWKWIDRAKVCPGLRFRIQEGDLLVAVGVVLEVRETEGVAEI